MDRTLPTSVTIPSSAVFPQDWEYMQTCWNHLANSIKAVPEIEFLEDASLQKVSWCCFEIRVDGTLLLYDYSDYLQPEIVVGNYKLQLRFHHTTALYPFPRYGSFPPCSFSDWSEYEALSKRTWTPGEYVLHRQSLLPGHEHSACHRDRSLSRRRGLAKKLLLSDPLIAPNCRMGSIPQSDFFRDALGCLCSVHIPGSWDHSLDRGQQQLFGLGVCTISPDIWTACGDVRPEAGQHYVGLRDDLSDLLDKVRWCQSNREEIAAIGARAKEFFAAHCTPRAIWEHIYRRLHE